MTRRRLLRHLDTARIEAAIREAERLTSGEIRVSVAGLVWANPQRFAERVFARLGMAATRERNAVLLLLLPWHRRVVILGDSGIHAAVGPAFWSELATTTGAGLQAGRYTETIVAAVEAVGRALAAHFPPPAEENPDELPNTVDRR